MISPLSRQRCRRLPRDVEIVIFIQHVKRTLEDWLVIPPSLSDMTLNKVLEEMRGKVLPHRGDCILTGYYSTRDHVVAGIVFPRSQVLVGFVVRIRIGVSREEQVRSLSRRTRDLREMARV